jgi:hypothetical protein
VEGPPTVSHTKVKRANDAQFEQTMIYLSYSSTGRPLTNLLIGFEFDRCQNLLRLLRQKTDEHPVSPLNHFLIGFGPIAHPELGRQCGRTRRAPWGQNNRNAVPVRKVWHRT